ncbi:MAG TPA: ATP synthase F0 subunit A [Firmicutes bacterium]|nr:ATP synthase F0 subunit A [Bacillota bacterium]
MNPSILFYVGTFPVYQPVFWTWVIMALLSLGSFILTRNLQRIPHGAQHFLEVGVDWVESLISVDIGPARKVFVPVVLMTALYVGLANTIGVIPGAYSPTQDLSTTLALALLIYVLGHVAGILKKGFRAWLKGFFEPFVIMLPLNIAGEISEFVSHSFRLYGNIFGGGILLSIIYMMAPYVVPVPLLAWFGIIMGIIQTAVFTLLASVYLQNKLS